MNNNYVSEIHVLDKLNNAPNFNNNVKAQEYDTTNYQRTLNFSNIKYFQNLNMKNNIINKDYSLSSHKNIANILSDKGVNQNKSYNTIFNSSITLNDKKIESSRRENDYKIKDLKVNESFDVKEKQGINLIKNTNECEKLNGYTMNKNILNLSTLKGKGESINRCKYRNRLNLKIEKNNLRYNRSLNENCRKKPKKANTDDIEKLIRNNLYKNFNINNHNFRADRYNDFNNLFPDNYRSSEQKNKFQNFESEPKFNFQQNYSFKTNNSLQNNHFFPFNHNNFTHLNEEHNDSLFQENNNINYINISKGIFNHTNNDKYDNSNFHSNNGLKTKNGQVYNIDNNESIKRGLEFLSQDHIKKTRELDNFFLNPSRPLIQMDICEQIKFIIRQFEFYLQLLLQNIFLTDESDLKYRGYSLIYNMYLQKMRIINLYKLPHFEVYFNFCKVKKFFRK